VEQIGSSHIALPDLIIFGVAIVLYYCLKIQPPNSLPAYVCAIICGLMIVSIIVVLPLATNLTSKGMHALTYLALFLGVRLFDWNRERAKPNPPMENPPGITDQ
jgi:hypothetical protein